MRRLARAAEAFGDAWGVFWFRPVSTATMAVVRILFGLVALGWSISLGPNLMQFFSRNGFMPSPTGRGFRWGLLRTFQSDAAVIALYVALLIACVLLVLGLFTRVAAIVVFLGVLSFERRNFFVFNSGDGLIRILAIYLALAPSGVALSLDRWRKAKDRFWEFPLRSPWAVRLIQVQLSVIYVSTVWAKLRGETWNNGTAVSYAMRLEDLIRFRTPSFITDSLLITNLLTFGTLAIEASLGILVWNRRLRPWVLGFGIALHLSISISVMVGFFSAAIFVCYAAFVPEETMERVLASLRNRLRRSRVRALRELASFPPEAQTSPAVVPAP